MSSDEPDTDLHPETLSHTFVPDENDRAVVSLRLANESGASGVFRSVRCSGGMGDPATITVRELTPDLWPALERLFGANGACGGCWCIFWRLQEHERYEDVKGPKARRRFKALVTSGRAHGLLAFAGDEAVGWCAFERRVDLPRLDRAPSLRVDDAAAVWSLPCFFVKGGWRGRGVASALLAAAEGALRARGAAIAEGYPTKPSRADKLPAAWAYTGLPSMFAAAGFSRADAKPRGKQRWRKKLAVL